MKNAIILELAKEGAYLNNKYEELYQEFLKTTHGNFEDTHLLIKKFLENNGFKVVLSYENATNHTATTSEGICMSSNGYLHFERVDKMTKFERKNSIKEAIKEAINAEIHYIYVDLDSAYDTVISVSICYGRHGHENVKLSLQKLGSQDQFYSIYNIEGSINIYMIRDINEALKDI